MPNKWTFKIKPIKELLNCYVGDGIGWIDPYAGENSPAQFTNDINPNTPAEYHLHALDFIKSLENYKFSGAIFDPPYSLTQLKRSYGGLGISMSCDESKRFPSNIKDALSTMMCSGGYVLSFGWNSNGMGKKRGFEIVEILLVAHGGRHNDTIVTVEKNR